MQASWEIRWFGAGEPTDEMCRLLEVTDWNKIDESEQVYLRLPGVVDIGIKIREGQLQAKGRRLQIPGVQLTPTVTGVLEQWFKWTCKGPGIDPVLDVLSETAGLGIVVKKRRAQRKFHPGKKLEEVEVGRPLDRGIYFELTRLEVAEAVWWTLNFEAFPDDSDMPGHVVALAKFLLKKTTLALPAGLSHSYPSWLSQFSEE